MQLHDSAIIQLYLTTLRGDTEQSFSLNYLILTWNYKMYFLVLTPYTHTGDIHSFLIDQ